MWSSSSSSVSSLLKGATQTPAWMARRILLGAMNQQHHPHKTKPQIILSLDIQRDSIDLARISIFSHNPHPHNNDATTTTTTVQSLDPLLLSSRRLQTQTLHELVGQMASCQGVLVHWPLQQPHGRAGGPCGRVWYTLESLVEYFSLQAQQQAQQLEGQESTTTTTTPLFTHHHRPLCLWTPTTTTAAAAAATEDEWGRCALYGRTTPPPHPHHHHHKASVEHYAWPGPPDATQLWHDFCQAHPALPLPFELDNMSRKQQPPNEEPSRSSAQEKEEAAASTTRIIPPTTPSLRQRSCTTTLIDWRHAPATAAAAHFEEQQSQQQSWAAVV